MELVRILAFDTGTANTAGALLVGNLKHGTVDFGGFRMITTKKEFGSVRERIDFIGNEVRELIRQSEPTHMAFEDFTEQGKFVGKTYKEMAWITEHFRLIGREMGLPTSIYENGAWKKRTLKAMRASKEQVQHYLTHKLPGIGSKLAKQPNHVWDAVGIGYCQWLDLLN